MQKRQTKYSVAKVLDQNEKIVGYLTKTHEEKGLDIQLDLQGYTIVAL